MMQTSVHHRHILFHITRNALIGIVMVLIMLSIGMCGYHFIEKMPWVDAFENTAMILSGMGPVSKLTTTAGKIFAGCYALMSGLVFLAVVAIVLAPAIHGFFRRIHLETQRSTKE